MGQLAGFTYLELTHKLGRAGFRFDRYAKGSHEIWWNPSTRARTTVRIIPAPCQKGRSERFSGKPA